MNSCIFKQDNLNEKKEYTKEMNQKIELINDKNYKSYLNSKMKKIQEEIKDKIIDKYLQKIIDQQKEIEQLSKQLNESIKSSLVILKNYLNNKSTYNNILSPKSQKQKLKNEILNIKEKNDIVVHILNRNKYYKNLSYSTISSDNIKLKSNKTQTVEHRKGYKENNNLSLSSSRIKLNKYEVISPKKIKIKKIRKTNSKNKKERDSTHHTINNIDINDLNTYYLKEYNKKDNQKIEEIKTKLMNNNLPLPLSTKSTTTLQKNKNNNSNNTYKSSQSQNKYKKVINQNIINKKNKYSYGKSNLKKIFNSPKNIKTTQYNEKNIKCFNEYYINKNKIQKNISGDNKLLLDRNYLCTNPTFTTKNIIHKNININNNNNKIYINTDNDINSLYLKNMNNKHYKTQTNFYQHKVLNRGDNQLGINIKDIMLTTPNENNFDNPF